MHGLQVMTGFTLRPDRAALEIASRVYNGNATPRHFLWWANPAVKGGEGHQSVFPPDVTAVFDHGKRAVSAFPIATGTYYKVDYSAGVDISRYKNVPVPTSYMAEKSQRSEEHTSELQSRFDLVCRLLLEKKNKKANKKTTTQKTYKVQYR